jgi:WD40 repeat protein
VRLTPSLGSVNGGAQVSPIFTATPDGQRVFVTDSNGLHLLDARTGQGQLFDATQVSVPCYADGRRSERCAFSPDGLRAVLVDYYSTAGSLPFKIAPLAGGPAQSFVASGDEIRFDADGRVIFFDQSHVLSAIDPSGTVRPLQTAVDSAFDVAFSPDGRFAMLGSQQAGRQCFNCLSVRIVSTANGDLGTVASMGGPDEVWDLAFSPDSKRIFVIGPVQRTNNTSTDSGGDLYAGPVGGPLAVIDRDIDNAIWAGPDHLVVQRYESASGLPAGTRVLSLP